jgi:predicted S18 family serine protease
MVYDLPSRVAEKGFYLANRGDIAVVDLRIAYLANGTGPRVSTDQHFLENSRMSLEMAVEAAAKAVGYDPRYLDVRLSVQTVFVQNMLAIDGPSAGAVWTVAVASAILGDSIRPEVCMSGAIGRNLEVLKVGGLEDKIKGCRLLNYREMIVPSGQVSTDLLFKGKGYEIKLTEVQLLAEAYAGATGRPLRPAE